MLDPFQPIAATALAVLPGAMYVWGLERQLGRWGVRLTDRALRFVGYSAALHALLLPLDLWLFRLYLRDGGLPNGPPLPPLLWAVPLTYVIGPFLLGVLMGAAARQHRRWAEALVGRNRAPRAWDHLFAYGPGWVRMKLKSGVWVAGAFVPNPRGRGSYAACYPEDQDLYLAVQVKVDPKTGALRPDGSGNVALTGSGLLVRWEEVEYLEFEEFTRSTRPSGRSRC